MKYKGHYLILLIFALIILTGCARISETTKLVMGTSVTDLYNAKDKGRSQIFEYDYPSCYKRVFLILKKMKAYIYLHSMEKHRIVAMEFQDFNNTTEVGIFFSEVSSKRTKVEISCLSHSVLEGVSEKIFSALKEEKNEIQKSPK